MKYTVATAFAALASTAAALPAFTTVPFDPLPGKPFTVSWTNATGPVTIYLAEGAFTDLKRVKAIDSDDSGTSFVWDVPTDLKEDTYALEIEDSEGTNYSRLFSLTGTGTASSSTLSVSAASSTSSAASSAASSASSASSTASSAASSAASSSASASSAASSSAGSSSSSAASSSITSAASSASSSATTTKTKSSTSTSSTKTSSSTSSSATATATSTPPNTNNGVQAKSPLALVLLAVAALAYFN